MKTNIELLNSIKKYVEENYVPDIGEQVFSCKIVESSI